MSAVRLPAIDIRRNDSRGRFHSGMQGALEVLTQVARLLREELLGRYAIGCRIRAEKREVFVRHGNGESGHGGNMVCYDWSAKSANGGVASFGPPSGAEFYRQNLDLVCTLPANQYG